jgi:hypothetical protein
MNGQLHSQAMPRVVFPEMHRPPPLQGEVSRQRLGVGDAVTRVTIVGVGLGVGGITVAGDNVVLPLLLRGSELGGTIVGRSVAGVGDEGE